MPLRSGKKYLKPHLCKCGELYSNKEFQYKCSECFDYLSKKGIMSCKEFSEKCEKWVKDNTIDDIGCNFLSKNKNSTDQHLLNLLTNIFNETGKYITSKTGLKLFKANRTNRRGHIICSFIADYWNIRSLRVSTENKWPLYLDCHYGNYSESMEKWGGYKNDKAIPPRLPIGINNPWFYNDIVCNLNVDQF